MTRFGRRDVEAALERNSATILATLPTGATLVLQHGSPTNGRAYRLYWQAAGETGLRDPFSNGLFNSGYLGWTAREAATTIDAYASGIKRGRQGAPKPEPCVNVGNSYGARSPMFGGGYYPS